MTRGKRWLGLVWVLLLVVQGCAPRITEVPLNGVSVAVPAGPLEKALRAAADEYELASGVRVQVVATAADFYDSHVTAYLLAGRSDYDLVYLSADQLPRWAAYHALQPLVLDPTLAADLAPWLAQVTAGGEVMGYPTQADAELLWYRADLFELAGLQPPGTWEAFHQAALRLDQPGQVRALALTAGAAEAAAAFAPYLAGFCAPAPAWECSSATRRQAVEFYRELSQFADPKVVKAGRAEAAQALRSGEAAVAVLPLSLALPLLDCQAEVASCSGDVSSLRWAPLPGLGSRSGTGSLGAWAVPLRARQPGAGIAFGAWLSSPVGAASWTRHGGLPATLALRKNTDLPESFAYLDWLAALEFYQPAILPSSRAASLWSAYHAAVSAVVLEGRDPAAIEAFFESAHLAWQRDLDR